MDMLNGGLAGKLILFSIPLAFSSILQQLFNSADVAVVGRFAGDQALAAVGSCVALVGIFVNLIVGLSVGPNAALANLIGQKNRGKINSMVHTILTFGAVLGIVLLVIGMLVARRILVASGTPETVLDQALLYIRIYFVGIPFMVAYNFGAAIVRSYGDTRRPMCYLIVSGVLNVIDVMDQSYHDLLVLPYRVRRAECNFKPAPCDRIPSGSCGRCHRHGDLQCGQHIPHYLPSVPQE